MCVASGGGGESAVGIDRFDTVANEHCIRFKFLVSSKYRSVDIFDNPTLHGYTPTLHIHMATQLHSYMSTPHVYKATEQHGYTSTLHGYTATSLHGYTPTQILSYVPTRPHGYSTHTQGQGPGDTLTDSRRMSLHSVNLTQTYFNSA